MDCNLPIKAVSPKFKKENVFRYEKNNQNFRICVCCNNEDQIEQILSELINIYEENVEVSFEHQTDKYNKKNEQYIWNSYYGKSRNQNIINALKEFHNLIYHNGFNILIVKMLNTERYIVFDEHGFIYVYNEPKFDEYLIKKNFKEVFAEYDMIDQYDHWHYQAKDSEDNIKKLIKYLKLKKV